MNQINRKFNINTFLVKLLIYFSYTKIIDFKTQFLKIVRNLWYYILPIL
jgi:hypothetical protein